MGWYITYSKNLQDRYSLNPLVIKTVVFTHSKSSTKLNCYVDHIRKKLLDVEKGNILKFLVIIFSSLVSFSLPKKKHIKKQLVMWLEIENFYLQLEEDQRDSMGIPVQKVIYLRD